jgi:hypothetical protein
VSTQFIDIEKLTVLAEYQMRAELSEDLIVEYLGLIDSRNSDWVFSEPCKVVRVGHELIIVDGFHRLEATRRACRSRILAEIVDGTRVDALRAALSANSQHGARLTNADKRRKVTVALSDETIGKLSNRQIADLCGVSDRFVAEVGAQLRTVRSCAPDIQVSMGCDGNKRPATKQSAKHQRERIRLAIDTDGDESDRAIAERIGCSPRTVGKVRTDLSKQVPAAKALLLPSLTRIHPVLETFPVLPSAMQEMFTADIRKYGQRSSVVIDSDGVLLDGRSRLNACETIGITPRFEVFEGKESEKIELIYSLNLSRRTLSMSQHCMLLACVPS